MSQTTDLAVSLPTDLSVGQTIRGLLENDELKLVLVCPNDDYRLEYFTSRTKDRITGEFRFTRKYRLVHISRGTVTPEPWDKYDLDTQTSILTGLITWSRYRIAKVVDGWTAECPTCGHVMKGKIWEVPPSACNAMARPKCGGKLEDHLVRESLVYDSSSIDDRFYE